MTIQEFAKYVIGNMRRATLGNAMNIADKLDNPQFYTFLDFIDNAYNYTIELLKDDRANKDKCYSLLHLFKTLKDKYNSDFKYNKKFIIDDLVIEMWGIINGD